MSTESIAVTSTTLRRLLGLDLKPFNVDAQINQVDEYNMASIEIDGISHEILVYQDPWGGWTTDGVLVQVVEAGLAFCEGYHSPEFDTLKQIYFACKEQWENLFEGDTRYAQPEVVGLKVDVIDLDANSLSTCDFRIEKTVEVCPGLPLVLVWYGNQKIVLFTRENPNGDIELGPDESYHGKDFTVRCTKLV